MKPPDTDSNANPPTYVGSIVVIGPGKVGRTLLGLAAARGVRVLAVIGSDAHLDKAVEAAHDANAGHAGTLASCPVGTLAEVELIAVTTPDDRIGEVATALAARLRVSGGDAGARPVVFHCSGLSPSSVLAPVAEAGGAIGSMHPLKSMPDPTRAIATFAGTPCCVEGDARAVDVLTRFARRIGGEPFSIPTSGKPLYHAGAVMASNYVTALAHAAVSLYAETLGLTRERALALLTPLLKGAVGTLEDAGLPDSLTGPIERGDVQTIRTHVAELETQAPAWLALYRVLGRQTLVVARDKAARGSGRLTAEAADAIEHLLADDRTND